MKRMNESYGIGLHGQFIKEKAGWGPTFTSFPEDAKKFSSPKAAQKYIQDNELEDMGVSVVSLPLADDLDESRLKRIVAESVKKVLKEYNQNVEDWWRHNGSSDREQASGMSYKGVDNYLQKTDEWWESLSDEAKIQIYNDFFDEY